MRLTALFKHDRVHHSECYVEGGSNHINGIEKFSTRHLRCLESGEKSLAYKSFLTKSGLPKSNGIPKFLQKSGIISICSLKNVRFGSH
jgi:hypothetical protein